LAIAKGLVAPEGAAAEVFEFKCNVLINNIFFKRSGGFEAGGLIHFSEELGQNPLKTVHCLSFYKARFEVQLLSNQSRQK